MNRSIERPFAGSATALCGHVGRYQYTPGRASACTRISHDKSTDFENSQVECKEIVYQTISTIYRFIVDHLVLLSSYQASGHQLIHDLGVFVSL